MREESGSAFGTDEGEDELRIAQERVCRAARVSAIAYEGYPPPAFDVYVAHVFMEDPDHVYPGDPEGKIWAGTVWREDRFPTLEEIADGLSRWRGAGAPVFEVRWWKGED
jgi:hypothetical protein